MRRQISDGFAVPLAASVSVIIALLLAGAMEYMRVQMADMAAIRKHAVTAPALQSAISLAALMIRASSKDAVGLAPDATVGKRLLDLRAERVFFDGTPVEIQVLGRKLELRIQDEAGLVPLNILSADEIARFLVLDGVPDEVAKRFAAEVDDFKDSDDVRQQGGAERDDYVRGRLRPPKNRGLNLRGEFGLLRSSTYFSQYIRPQQLLLFGLDRNAYFNINAADPKVLVKVFGFSDASASRVIEERRKSPIQAHQVRLYAHRMESRLEGRIVLVLKPCPASAPVRQI